VDTLTHALIGAVAARATAPARDGGPWLPLRTRTLAGGLAAAFPDIDFLTAWLDPLSFIADWHRAETHSFVMLPVWALLLGLVFAAVYRRKGHAREFVLVCGLAVCTHILSDLITSWGTQIFAPLSHFAPALSITFIIDPYFTAIVAGSLLLSMLIRSRPAARAGLALLVGYVGMQAAMKFEAQGIGQAWAGAEGLRPATVYAMPQPFSPFNWKLIVQADGRYHVAYLNLLATEPAPPPAAPVSLWGLRAYYRPADALVWQRYSLLGAEAETRAAWSRPELERYRRFARYPAVYRVDRDAAGGCVWFMDLRFTLPAREDPPFRYGVCSEGANDWRLYRLKAGGKIAL